MVSRRAKYLLNTINAEIDSRNEDKVTRQKDAEKQQKNMQIKEQNTRDERMLKTPNADETELEQQAVFVAKAKNKKNQRQRVNYEEQRTRKTEYELGIIMQLARRRNQVYS